MNDLFSSETYQRWLLCLLILLVWFYGYLLYMHTSVNMYLLPSYLGNGINVNHVIHVTKIWLPVLILRLPKVVSEGMPSIMC